VTRLPDNREWSLDETLGLPDLPASSTAQIGAALGKRLKGLVVAA